MQPTEVLKAEHRVIERVLGCLERIAEDCAEERRLDALPALQALDFLQTFADGCHHHKEEDILFPALEAKGFPARMGPLGQMRAEHAEGRRHVRAMAAAVEDAALGDPDCVDAFVTHARTYARLLRDHILKEDECLFPMAEVALSGDDRRELGAAFGRAEDGDLHAGTHERYLEIAEQLSERFGVDRAAAPCGCSGARA
jgi:hemerythrin-like domain-containing protein